MILIKRINQDTTDFKMQVFRLLSHIAPTGQEDKRELAGSRAIKKAQKEDSWQTWAKASVSPEELP